MTPVEIKQSLTEEEFRSWQHWKSEISDKNTDAFVVEHGEETVSILESLAASRNENKKMREITEKIRVLLPGWREIVAEIDDLPKPFELGKAMWAVLDQMDESGNRLTALIKKGE